MVLTESLQIWGLLLKIRICSQDKNLLPWEQILSLKSRPLSGYEKGDELRLSHKKVLEVKRFTDIPINRGLNLKKIEPRFGFYRIGLLEYLNFACMLQNF